MEIFKLVSLTVRDHDVFKEKVTFNFFQVSDPMDSYKPYFTMVLGPNGTGKSNLLKLIIEIFKLAYEKNRGKTISQYPKGKYSFQYFLEDSYYTILNTLGWYDGEEPSVEIEDSANEKGLRAFKDGKEIKFKDVILPNSILAVSVMLNDKFPVFGNKGFPLYQYLGVKRDANTAGTRSYITKTIEMVFKAANKKSFLEDISRLLEFLELDNNLVVSYSLRYKNIFFNGDMTEAKLIDFFENYKKYLNRKTEPWSINLFKNIREFEPEIIPRLVDLINFISSNLHYESGSRTPFYEFDIFNRNEFNLDHFNYLPYLQRLNLLSYPSILLRKVGRYFTVEESSSGEYHLTSTVIGILACINSNTLILLDEPEISLHPNWQMKYIGFLNEIFKKYYSTHFIICSHSHFLVSDLKADNSVILSLSKSAGGITSNAIIADTYGWSSESVLYNVFKVRTTRNHYLEVDIMELVELMENKSTDTYQIESLIRKFESLSLLKEDPLNELILEAKNYLVNDFSN